MTHMYDSFDEESSEEYDEEFEEMYHEFKDEILDAIEKRTKDLQEYEWDEVCRKVADELNINVDVVEAVYKDEF